MASEERMRVFSDLRRRLSKRGIRRTALAVLLVASVVGFATLAFRFHFNLSTAGSLEMLLVLVAALRLGFVQATIVSVCAFLCLNFLFTAPVYTFSVADPQNWVSLFAFETTALLVSGLSSKVRGHAAQVEHQRERAIKLYELCRAILLIDLRQPTAAQLSALIGEIFGVEEVDIWELSQDSEAQDGRTHGGPMNRAYEAYLADQDSDDVAARCSRRMLRLGTSVVGAVSMRGWQIDPLAADAIASLSAITFERTRAIQRETRVEIERDAEKLRTAVLDGLAHGFKTPLTAIQTASSGLLAIDQLSATQAELVSIIDERATMLSQLTTRLLQTAALEAREIRLRRRTSSIVDLLNKLVAEQDDSTRERTVIKTPATLRDDQLDAPLVELALQQLVDNAAKYSAIGSSIEITVNQTESETEVVVQNVALPGSSIRPEERTRIFERFYRGADAIYGPAGTGVGLSIVKKTAEAHGGRVSVECSERTTRFIFAIQHYTRDKHG